MQIVFEAIEARICPPGAGEVLADWLSLVEAAVIPFGRHRVVSCSEDYRLLRHTQVQPLLEVSIRVRQVEMAGIFQPALVTEVELNFDRAFDGLIPTQDGNIDATVSTV